jgi:hypothetical protein
LQPLTTVSVFLKEQKLSHWIKTGYTIEMTLETFGKPAIKKKYFSGKVW